MSDAALRALERAAAADPARAVAWARALVRAGRVEEAWRALAGALDAPAVRDEVAARPAWTHVAGFGRANAIDLPPPRRAPRLRWAVDGPPPAGAPAHLLASLLGVVLVRDAAFDLLDPATGRLRARLPQAGLDRVWPWLDGQALLGSAWPELVAWRLADGVGGRARLAPPGATSAADLLVGAVGPDGAPRGAAAPVALPADLDPWTTDGQARVRGGQGLVVAVAPRDAADDAAAPGARPALLDVRVAGGACWASALPARPGDRPSRTVVVDAAGRARARLEGRPWLVDADGAVVAAGAGAPCRVLDAALAPRWTLEDGLPVALGREVVVATTRTGRRLRVLDRATGALRATLVGLSGLGTNATPVVVGDVVVGAARGAVRAATLDGERLWEVDLAALLPGPTPVVDDLAPLPGAVVVALADGRVACLEAPPP